MRKLFFTLMIIGCGISTVQAQSETESFNADGIKVIFKPTVKNVINIRIYFKGGVTNYPANKAGIEALALNATTKCGTKMYSAPAFKDTLDKYGIEMIGTSTYDYGYIQLNCISKYFNKGWNLFSDAVMNPVFDTVEVDLLKNNLMNVQRDRESNPAEHLADLQLQSAFSNTPYAIDPLGNERTIGELSATDLGNYYKTLLNKNKIFIVVVGNVTKQEVFEKILMSFGNMSSKTYTPVDLKTPVFNDNKLFTEKRDLKLNYISAIMNAPGFSDLNYIPFRMGMRGLGGDLYFLLRSQNNLAYASYTEVMDLRMPFATMNVSSIHVQEAMDGMLKELKEIQAKGLNDEWLQHIKNTYITDSFIDDQSAADITNNLGEAEILGGWQYADDLPKLVDMVTVEQINNALNFYILGLKWTYLGNTEALQDIKIPVY